jgi:Ca-activated chloride channel family protein
MRAMPFVMLIALVTSVLAAPKRHEPGALAFVLDRSRSMKGPTFDAVKEAVVAGIDVLDPSDQVAIVTVNSDADVLVPLQPASRDEIAKKLSRLEASGGTYVLPGLRVAFEALRRSKLKIKHVIFVSDGGTPSDGIPELMEEMHDASITVTAVGVLGADKPFLQMIAEGGDGRLYMVNDSKSLSKVFAQEIKRALP